MFYSIGMFSPHGTLSQFSKANAIAWFSMAFQAGAINTGGYLACHRFVSHVTGFGTLIGTEGAQGNWRNSLGMLSVPAFFMGGAMVSAFFVDNRIQSNLRPRYSLVLFIIFLLLLLVTIFGVQGFFGEFGSPMNSRDYILLASLCLACGLQNSTVTSAFGSIVRTTHLTGVTTDLAIGVVRVISGTHILQSRSNEIRANWIRAGLISNFIIGSLLSAYIFFHAGYWGFLIPASLAMILFLWSRIRFNSRNMAS